MVLVDRPGSTQSNVSIALPGVPRKTKDFDALLVMNGIGSMAGTNIQNAQLFERLEAAHQRYRELFEDSIDPMLITDWDGNILEANRQAILLSGYTSEKLHTLAIDELHEVNWGRTGVDFEILREYITQFNAGEWPPISGTPENSDEEGIPFCP